MKTGTTTTTMNPSSVMMDAGYEENANQVRTSSTRPPDISPIRKRMNRWIPSYRVLQSHSLFNSQPL